MNHFCHHFWVGLLLLCCCTHPKMITKMAKKCSIDQRFIRKRNTTCKIHTLVMYTSFLFFRFWGFSVLLWHQILEIDLSQSISFCQFLSSLSFLRISLLCRIKSGLEASFQSPRKMESGFLPASRVHYLLWFNSLERFYER